MAFFTRSEAIALSQSRRNTRTAAAELRESAASAPYDRRFHIFLSHSSRDADLVRGIKIRLEAERLSVYVDWIDDPQLDRSRVTRATAQTLRRRMNQCEFLVYAASQASPDSRWMPWELGYFDGRKQGHVGIFPIVERASDTFPGLEYLGLYPIYELLDFQYSGRHVARRTGQSQAETLREAVGL
jgi:hypothetical protein